MRSDKALLKKIQYQQITIDSLRYELVCAESHGRAFCDSMVTAHMDLS